MGNYFPSTFSTCPIFVWTLPASFSASPLFARSELLVTCPVTFFTLPFTSCSLPLTWSFVLGFMSSPTQVCYSRPSEPEFPFGISSVRERSFPFRFRLPLRQHPL